MNTNTKSTQHLTRLCMIGLIMISTKLVRNLIFSEMRGTCTPPKLAAHRCLSSSCNSDLLVQLLKNPSNSNLQRFGNWLEVILKVKVRFLWVTSRISWEQTKISIIKTLLILKDQVINTMSRILVAKLTLVLSTSHLRLNILPRLTESFTLTVRINLPTTKSNSIIWELCRSKTSESNMLTSHKLLSRHLSLLKRKDNHTKLTQPRSRSAWSLPKSTMMTRSNLRKIYTWKIGNEKLHSNLKSLPSRTDKVL